MSVQGDLYGGARDTMGAKSQNNASSAVDHPKGRHCRPPLASGVDIAEAHKAGWLAPRNKFLMKHVFADFSYVKHLNTPKVGVKSGMWLSIEPFHFVACFRILQLIEPTLCSWASALF